MKADELDKFLNLYANQELVSITTIGKVLASLSINASQNLSGEFLSWDSEELASYRT